MGEFQKQLKSYRIACNLSQTQFAKQIEIPIDRYRSWESYITPHYGMRLKLAKQLNLKIINTPNPPQTFGQQLAYFRATENLTAKQLATVMGVSKAAVSSYEADKCLPKLKNLQRLIAQYPKINANNRLKYHH